MQRGTASAPAKFRRASLRLVAIVIVIVVAATTDLAPAANALSVTLATTSVIGSGSVDPSGLPINVAVGDRIRYALIAENPTGGPISVIMTTIFYDPAQLTLIASHGVNGILNAGGFGSLGLILVSPPVPKEGVLGELVAMASSRPGSSIGLGPDLAATLEFEVLDNANPIDVVQGFGTGDPSYFTSPAPSLFVPEPSGGLAIGCLALLVWRGNRWRGLRESRSGP